MPAHVLTAALYERFSFARRRPVRATACSPRCAPSSAATARRRRAADRGGRLARVQSDALVIFGATGDLAFKKIFPALHAMVKRGRLDAPVVTVGREPLRRGAHPRARAREHRDARRGRRRGRLREARAAASLRGRRLRARRRPSRRSARRSAPRSIPPSISRSRRARSRSWSAGSRAAGCAEGGRVVLEKPFGRDLASARELNRILHAAFDESSIFRIDHYLGKTAGPQPDALPLRQLLPRAAVEPPLRGERADHDGGELRRRGARALLRGDRRAARRRAEPPAADASRCSRWSRPSARARRACATRRRSCCARSARSRCGDLVRGQFRGYRDEPGVAADFAGRDLRGRAPAGRELALGRRAVPDPRRQAPAGHRDGGAGAAAAAAAARLLRLRVQRGSAEPLPLPPRSRGRDRARPRRSARTATSRPGRATPWSSTRAATAAA